jgi:hypothetical protein
MQNVVHFENPDGGLTHAQINTELQTNWIGPLKNLHNNNFTWVQLEITTLSSGTTTTDVFPVASGQGAQSGDAAPPFVSAVLKITTAFPGRKGRGRIFIPGLSIGTFGDRGKLTPGSYAAFQTTFLNSFRARYLPGGTANLWLGVTNRGSSAHLDFHQATGIDVRIYAGVQRRRNYFVGV